MRSMIIQRCYETTTIKKLKEDPFKGYFYLVVLLGGQILVPNLRFFSICKYIGFYLEDVAN
jgi:hypothetical protein